MQIKQALSNDISTRVMQKLAEMEGEGEVSPENEDKIKSFVQSTPNLDDNAFHDFCEALGVDPHEGEEIIYRLLYEQGNKTAAPYAPWQKLVTEALAKGEAWAMPALKRSLNATELGKILPVNAKTMAKNMSRAEAAKAAIKANIPEAGKRVFTGGPGSMASAGFTNAAGRFGPKIAPELNKVQEVGNPLLRKLKYEGLI